MPAKKPITKWNILALLCGLSGAAATITLDQLWLASWMRSGEAFPIGQRQSVRLPEGRSLVYYESPVSVPVRDVALNLRDSGDRYMRVRPPAHDISYRSLLTGWSGRALWQLDIPQAGTYTFLCSNHNVDDNSQLPAEDRVVFLKVPDALAEVTLVRKAIQIGGATITIALVILFYVLHGLALRRAAPAA